MKKLLWITYLISGIAIAQEVDSVAIDTAVVDTVDVEPPPYYLGVYLDGGISYEASVPNQNFTSAVGGGIQYERWSLAFHRYDFQGNVQAYVVFPNVFELRYRYAGPSVAYQFYGDRDQLALHLNLGYYLGDVVWTNKEDGQDFLRDEFSMAKIGLTGEYGGIRYIKPAITIGYQTMNDLRLSRLDEKDFSGIFIAVGIRIGYFNQ